LIRIIKYQYDSHFSFYLNTSLFELIKNYVNCWQDSRARKVVDTLVDPTVVPECLSTQLKTCLIERYKITECDIQFAIYIMQNAKVLNTMSIKSVCSIDINVKCQMIMKLATPARASTTCKLLFDWWQLQHGCNSSHISAFIY
jgi:hypothetical protein